MPHETPRPLASMPGFARRRSGSSVECANFSASSPYVRRCGRVAPTLCGISPPGVCSMLFGSRMLRFVWSTGAGPAGTSGMKRWTEAFAMAAKSAASSAGRSAVRR